MFKLYVPDILTVNKKFLNYVAVLKLCLHPREMIKLLSTDLLAKIDFTQARILTFAMQRRNRGVKEIAIRRTERKG